MQVHVVDVQGYDGVVDLTEQATGAELRQKLVAKNMYAMAETEMYHRGAQLGPDTRITADLIASGDPIVLVDRTAIPEKSYPKSDGAFRFLAGRYDEFFEEHDRASEFHKVNMSSIVTGDNKALKAVLRKAAQSRDDTPIVELYVEKSNEESGTRRDEQHSQGEDAPETGNRFFEELIRSSGVELSSEERTQLLRLRAQGIDPADALQVFMACDRSIEATIACLS